MQHYVVVEADKYTLPEEESFGNFTFCFQQVCGHYTFSDTGISIKIFITDRDKKYGINISHIISVKIRNIWPKRNS